jgi:hypothetical protein
MTRHNVLTTAVIAVATALLTLTLALPTQLDAVDSPSKLKPENATPVLTVKGVNMSLKMVSAGTATSGPVLKLVAVNTGTTSTSLKSTVAMLDRDDSARGGDRSGPAENTVFTRSQPINVAPGKSVTYTIAVNKPVAKGHTISFALTSDKESIRVAGYSNTTQVAMAAPKGR